MTKRLALCVGINDYPGTGNDLHGCENDAHGWTARLINSGYEVVTLLNEDATKYVVASELRNAMHDLRFGDRFVFTYSGHGSWVPDTSGDEADGRDECLVLHDWEQEGYLTDDDMYGIFQERRRGVRVTVFSDSCFSGTLARFFQPHDLRPRFFAPELLTPGLTPQQRQLPRKRDLGSRPGTVVFTGCSDAEYSYDATINGVPQGAFSAAALDTYSDGLTYRAWHSLIREHLPSNAYPQSPTLQATGWQRYWRL